MQRPNRPAWSQCDANSMPQCSCDHGANIGATKIPRNNYLLTRRHATRDAREMNSFSCRSLRWTQRHRDTENCTNPGEQHTIPKGRAAVAVVVKTNREETFIRRGVLSAVALGACRSRCHGVSVSSTQMRPPSERRTHRCVCRARVDSWEPN